MGILKENSEIANLPDKERFRYIQIFFEGIKKVVNGNIDFATNINVPFITVSFVSANDEVAVAHNLNRIPRGYIIVGRSANLVIYDGLSPWTRANLYLKSSAVGSAKVVVI